MSGPSKRPTLPEIGRLVLVTQGRDRGLVAVVVGQERDRFVFIADGQVRKAEAPKKKNILHVRSSNALATEVADEICAKGKTSNAQLRNVIHRYMAVDEQLHQEENEQGGL